MWISEGTFYNSKQAFSALGITELSCLLHLEDEVSIR